jgi:hypothetical protein
MPVVSLHDVVEAMDLVSDELHSYLDPVTGEIITFNEEQARVATTGEWDSAPAWMRNSLPKVKRALEDDRVLELPDRAHIDEWRMMQDFATEHEQCKCHPELLSATQGPSAFHRFKKTIQRLDLEEAWHQYRDMAFEQLARKWLDQNNIPYR